MPAPLSAQTIVGRVLDESTEAPVAGALITLVSRDGDEEASTLADSVGRFTLRPPEAGQYYLMAERIGYRYTRSPLLELATEGSARLELMLAPEPLGLEGLAVPVEDEAVEQLTIMGVTPAELGNRWIDEAEIDAIPIKRDAGTIVEWQRIGNLRVIRPENLVSGSDDMGLCFAMARARLGRGEGRCALIVWNGVAVSGPRALDIDPETIGSLAILLPTEAVIRYGKRGEAGAVLIWTR